MLVSSFFQFILSSHLSLLRRILTPAVAGTVIMLIPVTVMPIIFDMLKQVPEGSPALASPLSAFVTVVVITGIALKAAGSLRLWAPVIGVVVGSVVAGAFGLYDVGLVAGASWVGLPDGEWPGLDLGFGAAFWALLPAFVFVTLVSAIETVGDAVAIQRVSWRGTRAVDFRVVEGAVGADGVGNLLSGLAGTVPNTTYSTSISVTELTGVASRSVGIAIGVVFSALAFLPKALAVILAIPAPVVAAYATVLLAMLFVVGMKVVLHDELDYRTGLVVGVSFWAGVGFQNGAVFPEYFAEFAGGLLQNGMTAGGLVAILMTLFVELTAPRPSRIEVEFGVDALPKIREFLAGFASRGGWDKAMADRLDAAGEETLLTLMRQDEADEGRERADEGRERADEGRERADEGRERAGEGRERRRLRLTARKEGGGALLEFIAAAGTDNIQDRIALLGTGPTDVPDERELSLRLLRHIASRVHHQQYHDTDIVTVHVDAPSASRKES